MCAVRGGLAASGALPPSLRIAVARRARLRFATELLFQFDDRRSAEGFSPAHAGGLGDFPTEWHLDEGADDDDDCPRPS